MQGSAGSVSSSPTNVAAFLGLGFPLAYAELGSAFASGPLLALLAGPPAGTGRPSSYLGFCSSAASCVAIVLLMLLPLSGATSCLTSKGKKCTNGIGQASSPGAYSTRQPASPSQLADSRYRPYIYTPSLGPWALTFGLLAASSGAPVDSG